MRYLSLFSGIEAASVAWRPLGWTCAGLAEVDAFPSLVLAHHYPATPNFGDVTRYQEWPDATFDVLVGGSPCQSFSVAGLRKGLDDPRGHLMLTYGAIAGRYRPRWLVWENVPGVLSNNSGRDFGTFLGMLGELGYGFAYRVLDAQHIGVPQKRRRVFVVGHLGDWRRAAAVLFESHSLSGHPPPRRETGSCVAALTANGVGTCGADDNQGQAGHLIPVTATALTSRQAKGVDSDCTDTLIPVQQVTHALTASGFDASEDGTGRGTPLVPVCFDTTQLTHPENRSNPRPGDPCHPLAAGAHPPAIAFNARQDPDSWNDRTGPLDTDGTTQAIAVGYGVRRLTPRECERLQGFPDDYTLISVRGKPAKDGPRYKALGNSMAVPVMKWIGERIAQICEVAP
jgi:DNA (cytosine-5)-methyltransferase 1